MNYKINTRGSILSEIIISTSCYGENLLHLYLIDKVEHKAIETLQAELKKIAGSGDDWHPVYSTIPGNKARQIIDRLTQMKQISSKDRMDLEVELLTLERNLNYREKSVYAVTRSQRKVIEQAIFPYLKDIVAFSNGPRKLLLVLQYAFSKGGDWEIPKIQNVLAFSDNNKNECDRALGLVKDLKRICWGRAGIESTFKALAPNVPNLVIQRDIIAAVFFKAIVDKFEFLSIEDRFYFSIELTMMTCLRQPSFYAGDTKRFLHRILNGDIGPAQNAFMGLGGLDRTICDALEMASFTKTQRQLLIEKVQSKVLFIAISTRYPGHTQHQEQIVDKGDRIVGAQTEVGKSSSSNTLLVSPLIVHGVFAAEKNEPKKIKIPASFFCPLTLEVMEDPVSFGEHTFERKAIETWLEKKGCCPICRKCMEPGKRVQEVLVRNLNMLHVIEEFKNDYPELFGSLIKDTL